MEQNDIIMELSMVKKNLKEIKDGYEKLESDYKYLQTKYDNILATESGHENKTENVWQSGYATGHEAATKKYCEIPLGYDDLFHYMGEAHGLSLLQTEALDLINVVHKFHPQDYAALRAKADRMLNLLDIATSMRVEPWQAEARALADEWRASRKALEQEGEKEIENGY